MKKKTVLALAAAAFIGGCGKEFPETPWSPADLEMRQAVEHQTDYDSRLELARLYFMHNRIDEADALLRELVEENPEDMTAKAWFAANECKIAGRTGPWLLGMEKLYLVWDCLKDLDEAVQKAPDDFTVLLVQMNTDAEVDMYGSMQRALDTRARLEKQIEAKPDDYPPSARSAFFETAAHIEALRNNPQSAKDYWQRIVALNADPDGVERAKREIAGLAAAPQNP
jgi:tetratricopeptide (TPR) repeat protein